MFLGSKGWRSGENARLPPVWPGFKSRCWCRMWVEFVLSFAPRGFSPGTLVFPSPQKPTFPNSNSTRNQVDEEPLCGCPTSKSLFISLCFARFSFVHFQIISEILPLSYFNGIICPIPFPFAKRRDLDRYSVSKTPTWWGDYFLNYPAFFHRSYLLSEPKQEFIASHQNQLLIPRKPLFQIWQQNGG